MRYEAGKQRNRNPVISIALEDNLRKVLDNSKQAILFLNRKGFATYIHCIKCGYTARCKKCSIALTYHSSTNTLICHYCGYRQEVPQICPECDSSYIRRYGKGTEKVVSSIKRIFPQARVARMDADSMTKKDSHSQILTRFKHHKIDILVGTQMIAKGLDFPKVTLVGVISADTSLNLPDFRAAERTFSLLTQVAGRAGRADEVGKVIIQTYNPDHYSIIPSKTHNYHDFYKNEIRIRKVAGFPPFAHLVNITLRGQYQDKVALIADRVYKLLEQNSNNNIEILGPAPAPILRIKGKYRYNIILKSKYTDDIIKLIKASLSGKSQINKVYLKIDVDPQNIL